MRLIALEIPDDASDLAGWLERHLTGMDLAALVAELEAVHAPGPGSGQPPRSLETILALERDTVLANGLASLSPDRLRQLLRHPRLLLDLQELVLLSGSPYWRRRAESILEQSPASEQKAAVDHGWDWLTRSAIGHPGTTIPINVAAVRPSPPGTRLGSRCPMRLISLASAAAAVIVALAVIVVSRWPGRHLNIGVAARSGWGWNRPDALQQDLPRNAYLNQLADTAQEWFNKRPDDAVSLTKRLTEFRHGCTVLTQSPHKPLPESDRTWLVEKCRAWTAKLDAHLAAVESGQDPLKVRADIDKTTNDLIQACAEKRNRHRFERTSTPPEENGPRNVFGLVFLVNLENGGTGQIQQHRYRLRGNPAKKE